MQYFSQFCMYRLKDKLHLQTKWARQSIQRRDTSTEATILFFQSLLLLSRKLPSTSLPQSSFLFKLLSVIQPVIHPTRSKEYSPESHTVESKFVTKWSSLPSSTTTKLGLQGTKLAANTYHFVYGYMGMSTLKGTVNINIITTCPPSQGNDCGTRQWVRRC